jgi:hypothetical protein
MKRTRKWAFVSQEAHRLAALGLTALEIGRQLGITKSTVNKWIASGKLVRAKTRTVGPRTSEALPLAPAQWAAAVRKDYSLDATDDQIVTCAQQALELAYNMAESPTTRLQASGRFQALVKQLALVARLAEAAPEPVKPARVLVSRGGVDPRNVLQAVK